MSIEEPGPQYFSARVLLIGDVAVVEASGEIDLATVPKLRSAIEEALEQTEGSETSSIVVMDLSEVSFMDAIGIGLLVEYRGKLREYRAALRLVLGEGYAGKMLRLVELEGTFAVYPDLASAVEQPEDNA